jgi:hypothetical protein
MNRSFGGKATRMLIEQGQGFLGSIPRTLEPGDTQSLVFASSDEGPFWLFEAEKEACQHDK